MLNRLFSTVVLCLYFGLVFSQNIDSISSKALDYYEKKDYNNALILYNELTDKNVICDKDLFVLGKIYYQTNKLPEAIEIFMKLTLKEKNINASLYLARSYFKMDTAYAFDRAKPFFLNAKVLAEGDTSCIIPLMYEIYDFFGSYYLFSSETNYDSAKYYFNKIISLSPTNKEYLLKGYNGLSICSYRLHDKIKARYYLNIISKIESGEEYLNDTTYINMRLEDIEVVNISQPWITSIKDYSFALVDTTRIIYSHPTKALKYARKVLDNTYGKEMIDLGEPYNLVLIDDKFWSISGSLPTGSLGGVGWVIFSKYDGDILYITHGK